MTTGETQGLPSPAIVFSDLDGTFLDARKSVPEKNLALLDRLAEKDIPFVPCSGRPAAGIPEQLLAHPATRFIVAGNGSSVCSIDKSGDIRPIHSVAMDPAMVLRFYQEAKARDMYFDAFCEGHAIVERRDHERMGEYITDTLGLAALQAIRTPVDQTIPEYMAGHGPIERITIFWKRRADFDAIASLAHGDPSLHVATSAPWNIEITSVNATKGTALVWLCEHLGIDVATSYAFGDSGNDTEMLEAAGIGVAMVNADSDVAALADAITATDNNAGGVGDFLFAEQLV